MSNKRILIITYNWPPRNAIGTHRPYAWAKYWSSRGFNVTVLTSKKYQFDEPLDLHLNSITNITVHEIPYLENKVFTNWFLGKGFVTKYAKKLKNLLKKKGMSKIEVRDKWEDACVKHLDSLSKNNDIVISTFGPAATHRIASRIKKLNPNIFWVADYRDLWSLNHLSNLDQHTISKLHAEEVEIVSNANLLSTVSEGLGQELKMLFKHKKEVLIVHNGFDLTTDQLKENLQKKQTSNKERTIRVVYTGRIYSNYQDPLPILVAIHELVQENLIDEDNISIDFYGASCDAMKDIIKDKPEFKPYIRTFGYVTRENALLAQKNADLLLILESEVEGAKGILTGKLFEYISSGTPIINIGNVANSGIENILESTSTGISVNKDIHRIKQTLLDLKANNNSWFKPNIEVISDYSRESQSNYLIQEILKKFEYDI